MKWNIAACVLTTLALQVLPVMAAPSSPAAGHVITDFEDFPDFVLVNLIKHGDIVIESNMKMSINGSGIPLPPIKGKYLHIYNPDGVGATAKITFPAQVSGFSFDYNMRGFNGTYPSYACRYSNGTEEKFSITRESGTAKCEGLDGTQAVGVSVLFPAKVFLFFNVDNIVAL